MRRRAALIGVALPAAAVVWPSPALAHALEQKADLPIPKWLFGWAAAMVLIVSFVALAVLWVTPRLEEQNWRPLPRGVGRVLASRGVEIACGAIGLFLLAVVVWAGLAGEQVAPINFAPTFVYVIFWVGFVAASLLFGDVFRAFNPWRAVGRAVGFVARGVGGDALPQPLPYPTWLGRWPAVIGVAAFAWLELAYQDATVPRNVALAALVYSVVTWVAMVLYGVERWCDRGEAFSVYFNLFSRISVFERRGDEVGLRRPLSGLAALEPLPGTVALVAVMIGSVTFDGLQEGSLWTDIGPELADFFLSLGVSASASIELAATVGLIGCVVLIGSFYGLGVLGAWLTVGGESWLRLARGFAHSLVPIALAYVAAHYLTFLLFQGQAIIALSSNPLGRTSDLFGTADRAIDYSLLNAEATWYLQVAFVVTGHVAALALAHDRALTLYRRGGDAIRSQLFMLAVMVGFTSLALWLLSQANA